MRTSSHNIWKSVVAGALGGLVASLAMNQFQAGLSAVSEAMDRREKMRQGKPQSMPEQGGGEDDSTMKAANAISSKLFDHKLSQDEKAWAGPVIHYAMGVTVGALYGALADCAPVQSGDGAGYGAAVWLIADETAVPSLGLSGPPTETPVSGHLEALASHLVFGWVTHFTRLLVLS